MRALIGIVGLWAASLIILGAASLPALASDKEDRAAEMARQLQDPLAGISAIMTENRFAFRKDQAQTNYQFDIEPILAIDFPERGFTLIPRAVIPVIGAAPWNNASALPSGNDIAWGISDVLTQLFIAPKVTGAWEWGLGGQISLDTHTDDAAAGPGWGCGPSAILVGNFTEQLSFAGILGHLWSFESGFSVTSLQPMLFYNLSSIPGAYVAYEGTISADWQSDSDDMFTIPLGFVAGKTFDLGGGYGLDINLGPYWNAVKPDGAADWFLKFGLTILLP